MSQEITAKVKSRFGLSQKLQSLFAHEDSVGTTIWQLELLLVIVLATAYLLWFSWPLFWSASENVRLVGTFNSDEEAHVRLLKEAIDSRFPRLGYIQYGYGYLNMGLFPLFLMSYFTEVTEQDIIVWLRMIPAVFAIATIALVFLLARRYFGHLAAWIGALLLAFVPLNFLEMSSISHSDVPQVFFLVLGLYFCCRLAEERQLKYLVWASIAAGLAFGCKYTGLFLLPLIWFLWIAQTLREDSERIDVKAVQIAQVARYLTAISGVAAIGAGILVIPYFARPYGDAEYFGVSLSRFFSLTRLFAVTAGIGLLAIAALRFVWMLIGHQPKLADVLRQVMLSLVAFGVTFFITSPFNVFSVRSGFLRGFFYESLHSSFGHTIAEDSPRLLWFKVLGSPELLDGLILSLAGVSLALTLYKVAKSGPWKLLEPASVLWIWSICYFAFLFWRVNIRTHRALLPIIPLLIILAAQGVGQMIQLVSLRLSRRLVPLLSIVSVLMIIGVELPRSLPRIVEFRHMTSHREKTSTAVRAGHWLAEHYPPHTRVLYDQYSYVPPLFPEAYVTPFGGTLQLLETVDPDVVIVSNEIADRFSGVRQATAYARDESDSLAKRDYYKVLRGEEIGYALVRDFGDVQVYERQ